MPTVDVAFRPGDRAHIQQLREDVTVLAVSLPLSGEPQFECGYWLNGEWKRVWLPASELRASRQCGDVSVRSIDEWDESDGFCLWWRFPVEEPPFVGSPLDSDWPGYHTHFTRIVVPDAPADFGEVKS